jgi:hypothetical protein
MTFLVSKLKKTIVYPAFNSVWCNDKVVFTREKDLKKGRED